MQCSNRRLWDFRFSCESYDTCKSLFQWDAQFRVCTCSINAFTHTRCEVVQTAVLQNSEEKEKKWDGKGIERGWQRDKDRERERERDSKRGMSALVGVQRALDWLLWTHDKPNSILMSMGGSTSHAQTHLHTDTHHHVHSSTSLLPDTHYHLSPGVSD